MSKATGISAKKRIDGSASYEARIYLENGKRKAKTFARLIDAKTWRRKELAEKDQRVLHDIAVCSDINFKDFSTIFLESKSDLELSTYRRYEGVLGKYLIPFFGSIKISKIKMSDLARFRGEKLKSGMSSKNYNYNLKLLKSVMNYADKYDFVKASPFRHADFLKVQKPETKSWSSEELNKFLSFVKKESLNRLDMYLFTLRSGLRLGEVIGLKWDCVNFEENSESIDVKRAWKREYKSVVNKTKSGKARSIPLDKTTLSLLKKRHKLRLNDEFVFTKACGAPFDYEHFTQRVFYKDVDKACVRRIAFKDLRSTFASHFCSNGGNIIVLRDILGHHSVEITEKSYVKLNKESVRREIGNYSYSFDL